MKYEPPMEYTHCGKALVKVIKNEITEKGIVIHLGTRDAENIKKAHKALKGFGPQANLKS